MTRILLLRHAAGALAWLAEPVGQALAKLERSRVVWVHRSLALVAAMPREAAARNAHSQQLLEELSKEATLSVLATAGMAATATMVEEVVVMARPARRSEPPKPHGRRGAAPGLERRGRQRRRGRPVPRRERKGKQSLPALGRP